MFFSVNVHAFLPKYRFFMLFEQGIHNLQVIIWTTIWLLFVNILGIRLVQAITARKTVLCSRRGIAYIPKASAELSCFDSLLLRHKEELILGLQQGPRSHRIESRSVTGHVDAVRFSPASVEVDVIGSGECVVLFGVSSGNLDTYIRADPLVTGNPTSVPLISSDRISQLRSRCVEYTAPLSFNRNTKLIFPLPPDFEETTDQLPYVILTDIHGFTELTIFQSRSITASVQILTSKSQPGAVHALPIYSQNVDECMVCYDMKSNTVILNCRHCCICTNCIPRLRDNRCIVCRRKFTQYLFLPREGESVERVNV
jgi:hypothetical protein